MYISSQTIETLLSSNGFSDTIKGGFPFKSSQKRLIFSAEGLIDSPKIDFKAKKAWVEEFYNELNAIYPTLWLIANERELKLGVNPGYKTLFIPDYRELYIKAIASSSGVISFSKAPVLNALKFNIPSLFLCANEDSSKFAEKNSLTYMMWSDDLKPSSVVKAFLNVIKNKSQNLPFETNKNNEVLRFCSLSDKKYLPFFIGLVENLLSVHGDNIEAHLLCLDQFGNEFKDALSFTNVHFYELSDIWSEEELKIILSRSIPFRAFSSKPRMLLHVLEKTNKKTFYFDLDMFFYSSPISIWGYSNKDVIIFPQWSDRYEWFRTHGMFNAGMVAARPTGVKVIDWWASQCFKTISFDTSKGYFVDQAFLDLISLYFDNIEIYKKFDENIAPWNLRSLKIFFDKNDKVKLFNGYNSRVNSYHAAGPDNMGIYALKYGWDQLSSFFSKLPIEILDGPLYENVLIEQSEHWKELWEFFKMRELLNGRLRIKFKKADFKTINSYVNGNKRIVIKLFFTLHKFYRKFRKRSSQKEDEFWVDFQRKYLFEDKNKCLNKIA